MVESSVVSLPTREALARFVRDMLCSHDRLDPAQTPMYQAPLKRRGKDCGIVYHVDDGRITRIYEYLDQAAVAVVFGRG